MCEVRAQLSCVFVLCARVSVLLHTLASQVTIAADDGIRPGATAASLSGLKTVFKRDGTTTAGNSSQVRAARGTRNSPEEACLVLPGVNLQPASMHT